MLPHLVSDAILRGNATASAFSSVTAQMIQEADMKERKLNQELILQNASLT